MVKAMKIAGLFDVTKEGNTTYGFISEPEAAALTCLKENAGRYKLDVGHQSSRLGLGLDIDPFL